MSLLSIDAADQLSVMAITDRNDPSIPRTCEMPMAIPQDLQHSLASTIRDLRRDLEQRNGFIDHLESSLQSAHSEKVALDESLKNANRDLRVAHDQIRISEELVSRDRNDLTEQISALQRDNRLLRDKNASLRAATKHHEAVAKRNEILLDQEQIARIGDRHRYQNLLDLAEGRLELLASELASLQSQHQPRATHSLSPPIERPLSEHREIPARAVHVPVRDSFPSPAQSLTLADELDASSISSLEDDTSDSHMGRSLFSSSDTLVSPEITGPAASEPDSDYFAAATAPASAPPSPLQQPIQALPANDLVEGPSEPVFDTPMASPLLDPDTLQTLPPSTRRQARPMPSPEIAHLPTRSGPIRNHYVNASTQTDFADSHLSLYGQARKLSLRPLQLPALAIRTTSGRLTPTSPRRSVTAGSPLPSSPLSDSFKRPMRPHRASTRFPTRQQRPCAAPSVRRNVADGGAEAGVESGGGVIVDDAEEDRQDARPSELSRQLLDELRQFSEKADRALALGLIDCDSGFHLTEISPADDGIPDELVQAASTATVSGDFPAALRDTGRSDTRGPSTPRRYRSDPALRITSDLVSAPLPPIQVPNRRSSRGMTIAGPHAPGPRRDSAERTRRPRQHYVDNLSSDDDLVVPRSRASKASLWNAQRADGKHWQRASTLRPHASGTVSNRTLRGGPLVTAGTEKAVMATADDTRSKELLIEAIASTMIGEWMWKAPRKRRASLDLQRGGNKQKRWIWISLEQRTVMWSSKQPKTEAASAGMPARTCELSSPRGRRVDSDVLTSVSVPIKTILDVKDTERGSIKAGGIVPFGRSIVVQTPDRSLKFNAPNAERHYAWLMSLSYVANPTQIPGIPRLPFTPAVARVGEKARGARLRKKSMSRRSSTMILNEAVSGVMSPPGPLRKPASESEAREDEAACALSDGEGLAPETREAIASLRTEGLMVTPNRRAMARLSSLSTLQSQTTSGGTPKGIKTPVRRDPSTVRRRSRMESLPAPANGTHDWKDGCAVADMMDKTGTVEMTAHADSDGVTYKPVVTSSYGHVKIPRLNDGLAVGGDAAKRRGQGSVHDPVGDDVFSGF